MVFMAGAGRRTLDGRVGATIRNFSRQRTVRRDRALTGRLGSGGMAPSTQNGDPAWSVGCPRARLRWTSDLGPAWLGASMRHSALTIAAIMIMIPAESGRRRVTT